MPGVLIGVTTYHDKNSKGDGLVSVQEAYLKALAMAGASPILIPLGLTSEALTVLTARLDGILFTGGGDVHPRRYGSHPHPLVSDVDEDRDRVELFLLDFAIKAGLPFLGICRGVQLINVGLGGSLYEDISDQRPGSLSHPLPEGRTRSFQAHTVSVEPGSRLSSILKMDTARVNSIHHQGIRNLAPSLQASAFAPDGLIEAVELPGHPFGLGVQWHPEWLTSQPEMCALFQAFADAARNEDT